MRCHKNCATGGDMSPVRKTGGKKAAATRNRNAAGKKAAATRKHRAAGRKAARTHTRRATATKAVATRARKKEEAVLTQPVQVQEPPAPEPQVQATLETTIPE